MTMVAVAHDPGGANAVAVTVAALRDMGVAVEAFAKGPAVAQFQRLGVACTPVPADHLPVLSRIDGDLLVMGTSAEDRFELDAMRAAHARRMPVVGIMDYWSNYRQRFTRSTEEADGPLFPDILTALDAESASAMEAAGIPRERIRVTGQPYFGWLMERGSAPARPRNPVRRVLFASQPDANEVALLGALIPQLRKLPDLEQVLIRFHPRQTQRSESLDLLARSGLPFAVDESRDLFKTLAEQDRVLGITSVILIEAALMGVPAASLVMGIPDTLESNRWGLTRAVTHADQLRDFFAEHAAGNGDRSRYHPHWQAHLRLAENCRDWAANKLLSGL